MNQLILASRKKYESQIFSQAHHWLWRAVCEARPTEGDGPDAGGSAFFDRTKNDGMLQKKAPMPVKNSAIARLRQGFGG
ncbi:MAG: hypothetical protein Q7U74_16415 [Saprospiraceae bacterium]|nr:hypothetical protein [Saprospiraceae bacterium]